MQGGFEHFLSALQPTPVWGYCTTPTESST